MRLRWMRAGVFCAVVALLAALPGHAIDNNQKATPAKPAKATPPSSASRAT